MLVTRPYDYVEGRNMAAKLERLALLPTMVSSLAGWQMSRETPRG